MKKIYHFAIAATVLFAMVACGNNNANQKEENKGEETTTEQTTEAEPVTPVATDSTYDHYEWQMTLPIEGWKVTNAYSEMAVEKEGEDVVFNVKDWTKTTIEKCTANGCLEENRQEDIVTGDYTWVVYTKAGKYDVACYTFDPDREMVVRIGAEKTDDPKDARLMAVLEGFAFKKK